VLPFGAAQRTLNTVGTCSTSGQDATNMIPSFARATGQQAAIGGTTGYALTPDQENRSEAATYGAIGGAGW